MIGQSPKKINKKAFNYKFIAKLALIWMFFSKICLFSNNVLPMATNYMQFFSLHTDNIGDKRVQLPKNLAPGRANTHFNRLNFLWLSQTKHNSQENCNKIDVFRESKMKLIINKYKNTCMFPVIESKFIDIGIILL